MSARERMVEAAFALFDERGYDATTVEMIVERAGVSRSTFFRAFGSKEDVIFPRHADLQARIEARLSTASLDTFLIAVREAAGLVLEHYLGEGSLALDRYRLTRSVPALRDRELASLLGYQRLFREQARRWLERGDGHQAGLRAELLAAAVVTAHNVVLRRYLRGGTTVATARAELVEALDDVLGMARGWQVGAAGGDGTTGARVVVLATDAPVEDVVDAVRRALEHPGAATPEGGSKVSLR